MSFYIQRIRDIAKRFESAHPEVTGRYEIKEEHSKAIFFIQGSDTGFDITLEEVNADEFILHAGNIHSHSIREKDESHEEFLSEQFYHIRSLLSPLTRIIEYKSGATPYKWTLQYLHDKKWENGETLSFLFYNYFGKRSQKHLQNDVIPPE